MDTRKIQNALRAENAQAVIAAIVTHGTGWLQLAGVVILLTADIWLGAQVFMSRGMDWLTSYLISIATSAVQIALFANGGELIGKASGNWKLVLGYAALTIGWIVAILDSFIDGLAALVKLGGGIPSTWHAIWIMLGDPIVLIAFILFFILSLMGERLARLVIHGEYEESMKLGSTHMQAPSVQQSRITDEPSFGAEPAGFPYQVPTGWNVIPQSHRLGSFTVFPPSPGKPFYWNQGQPNPWKGKGIGEPGFGIDN